jgi:large subunit ribosomal protein L14
MIQQESELVITDNSGPSSVRCIRVLGSNQPKYASVGDRIVGVMKQAGKPEIVQAVVVRVSKPIRRQNGMCIRFDSNAAVIVHKDGNPRGTRVFGPIARELRQKNYTKILSLAPEVF